MRTSGVCPESPSWSVQRSEPAGPRLARAAGHAAPARGRGRRGRHKASDLCPESAPEHVSASVMSGANEGSRSVRRPWVWALGWVGGIVVVIAALILILR